MDPTPAPPRPVMTVLEARVARERWPALVEMFATGGARLPAQMLHAYMVQSTSDPELWRGVSVWRSRAALEEYRRTVETPGGVLMFRAAGAEPSLGIFEVMSDHAAPTA